MNLTDGLKNSVIQGKKTVDESCFAYLEMAGEWTMELDAQETIVFCYKSSIATDTIHPGDLIGKHIGEFFADDVKQQALNAIRLCNGKNKTRHSLTYRDESGGHINLRITSRQQDSKFAGHYLLFALVDSSGCWCEKSEQNDLRRQFGSIDFISSLQDTFSDTDKLSRCFIMAMSMIGNHIGADRVLVLENEAMTMPFYPFCEWESFDTRQARPDCRLPIFGAGGLLGDLAAHTYVSEDDVARLPQDIQGLFQEIDVKSFVYLPILVHGKFWGVFCVECCKAARKWSSDEIGILQAANNVFSAALERRDDEKTMQETYTNLKYIARNVPGIVWMLDNDHVLRMCEGLVMEQLGIDKNDYVNRKLEDLTGSLPGLFESTVSALEKGLNVYMFEVSDRYFVCNTSNIRSPGGNIMGQVGVAQDITEIQMQQNRLKREVKEAEAANRAKSEFLSRMSHEIRTPMNAIIGMNSIARKSDSVEKMHYCLDKIENASKQLLGLINDILDMSKIESGKFEISDTEFDFEKMLQNITNVISIKIEEKKQKFLIDFDDVFLSYLVCDELRLSQVIINLITNAVKFTPDHGKITLKIRHWPINETTSKLHVEVIDTGIGISAEQRRRLFHSFEQADVSTTRKFGGTGLGLAICKKICTLMGGDIWVESQEGVGSKFIFEVDFGWGGELSKEVPGNTLDTSYVNILTVDDSEDVRLYFSNILDNFSLRNDVAASGEEALSMVRGAMDRGDPYNLIFIDWQMPGMSGIELSKNIKGLIGDTANIIVISVADWSDIESQALQNAISRFLPKPVMPSVLFEAIIDTVRSTSQSQHKERIQDKFAWAGKHILVAEDIDINQEIIESMLEDTGVNLHFASNGLQAVEMYMDDPFAYDLILMDIQMPELDGLQATRHIRESEMPRAREIPIIAMTANAFKEDVQACLDAGMDAHIAKPVSFDELLEKISNALGQANRA